MRPEHLQTMRGGKTHPLWAGVLDEATAKGLKSLQVRVVQLPTAENGHLAVVMARAEFEDGRVFEDVGDCSPASTTPQLATAALRLASTRAKGRVLRDATNIGEVMLEELGDENAAPAAAALPAASGLRVDGLNGNPRSQEPVICQVAECGLILDRGEATVWRAKHEAGLVKGGPFCRLHIAGFLSRPAPA